MNYEIQLQPMGDWIPLPYENKEAAYQEALKLLGVALRHTNGDIIYDLSVC